MTSCVRMRPVLVHLLTFGIPSFDHILMNIKCQSAQKSNARDHDTNSWEYYTASHSIGQVAGKVI